jgi:hypothetical protein
MNDQGTIEEAYAEALRNLYNVLLDAFVEAPQDQKAQNLATQRFSSGLAVARKARDAALAHLLSLGSYGDPPGRRGTRYLTAFYSNCLRAARDRLEDGV